MANSLYDKGRSEFLKALIDWTAGGITVKLHLIDTGVYTVDLTNHDFEDDISGDIATATITSRTSINSPEDGTGDAADTTFTSVTGAESEALVIWRDTGTPATSPLIGWIDTFASGMPVTPNGGDITVQWNASGIFKL